MINWALLGSYVLSLLVMVGLPILLSFLIVRRFRVSWLVVLTGAVAYALYYLGTMGVDQLFINGTIPTPPSAWPMVLRAATFGLISGIIEEGIRWLSFKALGRTAEKFGSGPALGVGHSGAESIFYGVLAIGIPLVNNLFFNPGREIAKGTAMGTVQSMLNSISVFWSQPFYNGLAQGGVSLVTLSIQIFLSILVWKSISDRQFLWFLLAVVYQVALFLFNTYLGQLNLPASLTIATMALILLINVYLSYRFITDEMEAEEEDEEEEDEDQNEDQQELELESSEEEGELGDENNQDHGDSERPS
jgi:uncharacterized membrane protein YhfC